jgi:hypothetical protein
MVPGASSWPNRDSSNWRCCKARSRVEKAPNCRRVLPGRAAGALVAVAGALAVAGFTNAGLTAFAAMGGLRAAIRSRASSASGASGYWSPAAAPSRCAGGARRCSRCARSPGRRSRRARTPSWCELERVTPSVASSAVYCVVSEASGSVRMRTKSSAVSASSSTRIGKRPCSSGIRSDGLAHVERARGDEQDVVGLHHAVLGARRCSPRPAAAGRAARPRATRPRQRLSWRRADLVDLVDEDDAVLLGVLPARAAFRSPLR